MNTGTSPLRTLTLMSKGPPRRCYMLREVLNALRWIMRAGERRVCYPIAEGGGLPADAAQR